MDRRKLGALAFGAMLVAAACSPTGGESAAPSTGTESSAPSSEATAPASAPAEDALGTREIPAGEPLHIAYWGVLSGADSTLGEDSKQGVEIALDDLKNTFKGHEIRLTTEDGLCTPPGGATAAQKLAADSTIVGLIGSSCSDETVGGIAAITAAGLTTISPSNTRPALTAADRDATYAGYLRTAHSDAFQGKAVAEFVKNELGKTTMATIHDGSAYAQALQQVAAEWLDAATLQRRLRTDGALGAEYFSLDTVRTIDAQVWGQAFEPPLFCDDVEVVSQRLVAEKHLKLSVRHAGALRDAIWFGHTEPVGAKVRLAYQLRVDEYNGQQRVQMVVEGAG